MANLSTLFPPVNVGPTGPTGLSVTGPAGPTGPAPDTSTYVTLNGVQTLTNKTISQMTSVIGINTNAVASTIYILTASLTLTLPSAPTSGDWVAFVNRSATTTPVIGRNGSNIMSLAEDMTLNNVNASGTLVYADATRGWVLVD